MGGLGPEYRDPPGVAPPAGGLLPALLKFGRHGIAQRHLRGEDAGRDSQVLLEPLVPLAGVLLRHDLLADRREPSLPIPWVVGIGPAKVDHLRRCPADVLATLDQVEVALDAAIRVGQDAPRARIVKPQLGHRSATTGAAGKLDRDVAHGLQIQDQQVPEPPAVLLWIGLVEQDLDRMVRTRSLELPVGVERADPEWRLRRLFGHLVEQDVGPGVVTECAEEVSVVEVPLQRAIGELARRQRDDRAFEAQSAGHGFTESHGDLLWDAATGPTAGPDYWRLDVRS